MTGLLVVLFFFVTNAVNAQIVNTETTVQANFGVDSDVYSGIVSFPNGAVFPFGTDDWFLGDSGKGVIDETPTAVTANLLVDDNASAEIRMSVPIYTVVDGRLWIDAVFIRDQNAQGNNTDSNVFTGGSDKNNDNPNTWTITDASVPQKNDIIDVFGHLRREGATVGTDEWAFLGASTRNDSGDSYLDFEYFREKVNLVGGTIQSEVDLSATGGRTPYVFNPDGSVLQHGDIILSVNYANGGANAIIKLYVWVELVGVPDSYFDTHNTLPFRPFEFKQDNNGYIQYDGGNGAGNYGYAEIQLRQGVPDAVFSQVNDAGPVPAGPWGTINKGGNIVSDYSQTTFAEIAINASALGFDSSSTPGIDCISPLGSVIVKTRSSDSFTAELKDLAGPFSLADTPEVTVEIEGEDLGCTEDSITLTATATPEGNTFTYVWYKNGEELEGETGNTLEVTEAGTYSVAATLEFAPGVFGCTAEDDFEVNGEPLIPLNQVCPENQTIPECTSQEDINSAFTTWLSGFSNSGGNGTVVEKYYIGENEVDVNTLEAPDACGGSIVLRYEVSDECEQVVSCERTFTVTADDEAPVIADQDDIMLEECNQAWPEVVSTTWTDNCGIGGEKSGSLNGVAGEVMAGEDGCTQYRDYTFNATDDCGNPASEVVIRVTRMYDETAPVIADQDDIMLEECNQAWPEVVSTTWTDNCGIGGEKSGSLNGVAGEVMAGEDGCTQYRDYTFNATDDCGNPASEVVIRVTRMYDETAPVIADQDDIMLEECNQAWPEVVSTTWTDNCGIGGEKSGSLNGVAGEVMAGEDGCTQYRDYTFNATDDCGNPASEVVIRVTRMYDETAPVIADQDDIMLEECNQAWPEVVSTTWTDNCGIGGEKSGSLNGVAGEVMAGEDGCTQYRDYTFNATDDCGNPAAEVVIRVTRMYDETAPVIADQDDIMLEECNQAWPEVVSTTWTDNCGIGGEKSGSLNGVAGEVMAGEDGCTQYRDYTFNATDDCGNPASEVVIRVTRMYDETAPVIADQDDIMLEECNQA
ncbi:hypothetical protein, partial [Tenacibaculum discolor]|uniref:hypothetical protein n=1 Tax=Tenacibaculum discolor TaxID=361581 RepID=UPI001ABF6B14